MNYYINNYAFNDPYYIAHHGIKGMKWGIRRFQDKSGRLTSLGEKRYARKFQRQADKNAHKFSYTNHSPLEYPEKTLPKGLKVKRISTSDEKLGKYGNDTYVFYTKDDTYNLRRISSFMRDNQGNGQGTMVERTYKLKKPVKIAPMELSEDLMMKIAIKNKNNRFKVAAGNDVAVKDDFGDIDEGYSTEDFDYKNARAFLDSMKNKKYSDIDVHDVKNGRKVVDEAFAVRKYTGDLRNQVINELKKRGYNGMYDNNMINSGGRSNPEAAEPLVIFDAADTMELSNERALSNKDISKARKKSIKIRERGRKKYGTSSYETNDTYIRNKYHVKDTVDRLDQENPIYWNN